MLYEKLKKEKKFLCISEKETEPKEQHKGRKTEKFIYISYFSYI